MIVEVYDEPRSERRLDGLGGFVVLVEREIGMAFKMRMERMEKA